MIGAQVFNALVGASLIFAAAAVFYSITPPLLIVIASYTLAFAWGAITTAGGYAGCFGNTWLWWEPVWELLFDPVLTPLLHVSGLTAFMLTMRMRRRRGE
ncbi:MAG: hypothetical protein ACK5MQ_10235 [Pikeienuella sp.]